MSSSPTPKSRWSRMGGAVRRASSVLVATRPSTPSIASSDRDDATSIKGINTTPAVLAPPNHPVATAPSPIAESPIREQAATQEQVAPVGPSPLVQAPVAATEAAPSPPDVIQTSPVQEYTPPPLMDSSATGPGAFTDEPDELPQPQIIRDPSLRAPESTDGHESIPQAVVVAPAPLPESIPERSTPVALETKAYFDIPVQDESLGDNVPLSQPTEAFKKAIDEDVFSGPSALATDATILPEEETGHAIAEPLHDAVQAPQMPTPEYRPAVLPPVSPEPAHVEDAAKDVQQPFAQPLHNMPTPVPEPAAAPAYPTPLFDFNSGQEVWGGVPHKADDGAPKIVRNGNASTRSRVSSIQMPLEDPFADPIAPRITVSHADHSGMPHPHLSEQQQPTESYDGARGPIVMPLPPVNDVIPSKSIRDVASTQSLKGSSRGNYETDETRPLLSRPGSPKNTSYLQPPSAVTNNAQNVSPLSGVPLSFAWPVQAAASGPRLHDFGWIEYQLPDGTMYYVHPTRHVTTDIDLREDKKLDALTAYLEHRKDGAGAPAGVELWLREPVSPKRGFVPARFWVDHRQKILTHDQSSEANGSAATAKKAAAAEDHLDVEYRYWSFMEAHPAHTSLPANARVEALDILTWAWTDRLLPSQRSIPAPFTQEECQELMSLLRSFGDQGDFSLQTVVQTRIVSRILLRVAHWRQQYFRPNKPLPTDVSSNDLRLPKYRRPFRRALVDFVVSCLCLGIPYIFFERTRSHRLDEESGLRNPAPMLVVGACTCLIAAIVLSASVTFLSLPGLDSIARVAGFVAILFASFSMASTVVAIFRYKADMESSVSHIGREGLMMLSRRSVVMSLPLVFLAYAIIGFISGIVLYSIRGVTSTDPLASQHPFEDYTRWTVIGVLGGLAGMLTTSLLLLRR
ncbi:hypothetical protein Hypma_013085 [Hypsizygus marmoreus]|uniref:WW domain-containing protein n=1 Tax=Hypsizygus marmoreus TaxID=39966 RepID=A0A369JFC3_HYPMA|nr:hypothetical protein Hypma_013085 [Hypsizygus marmoreus]